MSKICNHAGVVIGAIGFADSVAANYRAMNTLAEGFAEANYGCSKTTAIVCNTLTMVAFGSMFWYNCLKVIE